MDQTRGERGSDQKEISARDITTNLPYVEGAHLVFDHHHSETVRVGKRDNHIIDSKAPSAARVVYDYHGGRSRFPSVSTEMMAAVDEGDSAQFSREDTPGPSGLGPAQLLDGRAHGARALSTVHHLELSAHDEADRLLS